MWMKWFDSWKCYINAKHSYWVKTACESADKAVGFEGLAVIKLTLHAHNVFHTMRPKQAVDWEWTEMLGKTSLPDSILLCWRNEILVTTLVFCPPYPQHGAWTVCVNAVFWMQWQCHCVFWIAPADMWQGWMDWMPLRWELERMPFAPFDLSSSVITRSSWCLPIMADVGSN